MKTKNLAISALLFVLAVTPILGFAKENSGSKDKDDRYNASNHLCLKAFGQFVKNGWKETKGELTIGNNCKIPHGIWKKWNHAPHATSAPDTVAPIINSFTATPSLSKVDIKWSTNENVRAVVFYGTTTPNVIKATTTTNGNLLTSVYATNGNTVVDNTFASKNGELTIKDLRSGTTYYAVVGVRDSAGNVTISSATTFTTLSNADTTAPVISNILTTISLNKLLVSWRTNEAATSRLFYGTSTLDINASTTQSMSNNTLKTSHSFELSAVASTTPYHVILQSADISGNTKTSGEYVIHLPF